MLLILDNTDLPTQPSSKPNRLPYLNVDAGESAPLLQFKYYSELGIESDQTELGLPDEEFNIYKINLLNVESIELEGYEEVFNLKDLTIGKYYFEDYLYIQYNDLPFSLNYTFTATVPPNPSNNEFSFNIDSSIAINRIILKGSELGFGQLDNQIVVDSCSCCCPLYGGELMYLTGTKLINTYDEVFNVKLFNINIRGVIDYVEYLGDTYSKGTSSSFNSNRLVFYYSNNKLKLWN